MCEPVLVDTFLADVCNICMPDLQAENQVFLEAFALVP